MSSTAEVVIVGADIVGASAAYRLTEFGVHKVIVFERRVPAAGATGKSGAVVRLHYPNPFETRLALESLRFFPAVVNVGQYGFPLYPHRISPNCLTGCYGETPPHCGHAARTRGTSRAPQQPGSRRT